MIKIYLSVETTFGFFVAWILTNDNGKIQTRHKGTLKEAFQLFCEAAGGTYSERTWANWRDGIIERIPAVKRYKKRIE